MFDLSGFPITSRWAPKRPDVIQLYTLNTPNGIKASVMLEECGLDYDTHRISIGDPEDQLTPEFLSLNPNNKIPALIDPNGPDGKPMGLWESGAILIYLGDKTGRFLPRDGAARYHAIQWVMFQMGGIGPMFGQLGFFHRYKGSEIEDKRPRDRYVNETRRLLGVLDRQLDGRDWITGDYSIADIATGPWVRTLTVNYEAQDLVQLSGFANVTAWMDRFLARPAVQRGLTVGAA
ncbi:MULTISPECIES: glutathione S-transferase N-terminal domain-containing protein [unclassified Paracoccus (in: a-proteobacteria)]|uniref:glutathione S-transferase N-terminal domain-containing protein n=1 Tax=unclassified Paracoccus (in: a-proteobacteria) TaxID=2688777 RepID=UPI001602D88A|nr:MULTISPECIES: glutathione S-transferase N-terminal domain-containing protein [unclassified Paracoccus (in: a-proteobacteria)]MBB1491452.1 glutathione S-transferase N-terminal domain-containing protein [Paracoccus sp. MC1854]MBB1497664.1 glutathione S-transferase N-terminal domain-containing protein [Paracoccus sp. MC1862]QQO44103.1 glutathione S-transferase N-terminal domain-containing protein [Paracoccus sp. MC1862]